jgi:hypothetical protein
MADTKPKRIQRQRVKGWRMPAGAVIVTRQTRWGNPFRVTAERSRREAVVAYSIWIEMPGQLGLRNEIRNELRGHDLACWCKPGDACHADALLRIANE